METNVYRPTDFLIHDGTGIHQVIDPVVNGNVKGRGYVPRDYNLYPKEMFAPPDELPLIPRYEWSERLRDMEAQQSSLSHIRNQANGGQGIPALDQGSEGFCWAYSTTGCVMLLRAVNNQPYVRLSAHAIGCIVQNFKNIGGWCGLSAKFHLERGCPSVEYWPEQSMSRDNDTPETWENAARHKVTEDWVDLTREVYDRNLTFDQVATCLLNRVPCAVDYSHWSHSVCGMDLVDGSSSRGSLRGQTGKLLDQVQFDKIWFGDPASAGYGVRILNSWSSAWGDNGTGVLTGQKAVPDGAVALRVTGASPT